MTSKATALVQYGPEHMEMEEIPFPRLVEGSALIRVEANGLCRSDVDMYESKSASAGMDAWNFPRIIGHEIVGVIEELGPGTNPRGDLKVGDRVAVDPFIGCGRCYQCLSGDYMICRGTGLFPYMAPHLERSEIRFAPMHGAIPMAEAPGLWGGYSTHVYAHPNTVLYRFPEHVSGLTATLWNPLGAGFQWGVKNGEVRPGHKVLILGCGQRGLASIFAIRMAGAELVVVTGLTKDEFKLQRALEIGADAVINVEKEDLREISHELTGGQGFDTILDTTPGAIQPLVDAVDVLRPGGIISLAGVKQRPLDGFPIDKFLLNRMRIVGSMGQDHDSYVQAARAIASNRFPELDLLRTHVVPFDQAKYAMDLLTGEVPGEEAINVVLTPPADLVSS